MAMTDNIDIYRTVKLYIDQHGEQATIQAAMQADALLEAGDLDGAEQVKRLDLLTERNRLQRFPAFPRGDQTGNPSWQRDDDRPRRPLVVGQQFNNAAAAGEAHRYRLFLVVLRKMR